MLELDATHVIEDTNYRVMLMEYCEQGDLSEVYKKNKLYGEEEVVAGLTFLFYKMDSSTS